MITAITAAGEGVASAEVHASTDSTHGTITLQLDGAGHSELAGDGLPHLPRRERGRRERFFASAGTGDDVQRHRRDADGTGTPPTTDLTTKLSKMPALGAAANEVTVTGSPGAWTVTFSGDGYGRPPLRQVRRRSGRTPRLRGPCRRSRSRCRRRAPAAISTTTARSIRTMSSSRFRPRSTLRPYPPESRLDSSARRSPPARRSRALERSSPIARPTTRHSRSWCRSRSLRSRARVEPSRSRARAGTSRSRSARKMTNAIAIGSGAAVVQSAITALNGFTDTVTVTLSGSTYTLDLRVDPLQQRQRSGPLSRARSRSRARTRSVTSRPRCRARSSRSCRPPESRVGRTSPSVTPTATPT